MTRRGFAADMTKKEALIVLKYAWGMKEGLNPSIAHDIERQRAKDETPLEFVARIAGVSEEVKSIQPFDSDTALTLAIRKLDELRAGG